MTRLRSRARQGPPWSNRGDSARPIKRVVLAALVVCVAVIVVVVVSIAPHGDSGDAESLATNETQAKAPAAGLSETGPVGSSETAARKIVNPFETGVRGDDVADVRAPAPPPRAAPTLERRAPEPIANAPGRDDSSGGLPQDVREEDKDHQPAGDLTISGRVFDQAGYPVVGIKLSARVIRLFNVREGASIPKRQRQAVSGPDGRYAFEHLADGEYSVRTAATAQYARSQVTVRAGVDFADLVLIERRKVQVSGFVTSTDGETLASVSVTPVGGRRVSTDASGRYELEVAVNTGARGLSITAQRKGYRKRTARLDQNALGAAGPIELNIVLEPIAPQATVTGTVKGPNGSPVADMPVQLTAPRLGRRYRSTTDGRGRFKIKEVETGPGYQLLVRGGGIHRDYLQLNFEVPEKGLKLEVVLEPLSTGTLTGKMLDLRGNPVPNFDLMLRTRAPPHNYLRVTSDAGGNYVVEKAPTGELVFQTSSYPRFTISGIQVAEGAKENVPLILDWGDGEIHGMVTGDFGNPVTTSEITLAWSHVQNGMRSSSSRKTAADAQGVFSFSRLGPGRHTITINAPGYKPVRFNHDVTEQGSDVVVRLEEK